MVSADKAATPALPRYLTGRPRWLCTAAAATPVTAPDTFRTVFGLRETTGVRGGGSNRTYGHAGVASM